MSEQIGAIEDTGKIIYFLGLTLVPMSILTAESNDGQV